MAKFSLKSEHFITPLKLVLPGVIVSLVGASAAFFIFNNPAKNKAKQTYASWKVLKDYETAFANGFEESFCLNENIDQVQFRKDFTHFLEVLINNLDDLKKEENTDMQFKAFLNLKLARFNDSKKITEVFLDSVIKLNQMAELYPNDPGLQKEAQKLQEDYAFDLAHIETRDTNELKRIAFALNKEHKRYTDSFLLDLPKEQTIAEIKQGFIGKWRFPEVKATVEFKKDKTGIWEELGKEIPFQWTMADRVVTLYFDNETHNFYLVEATATKFSSLWREKGFIVVGCRKPTGKDVPAKLP